MLTLIKRVLNISTSQITLIESDEEEISNKQVTMFPRDTQAHHTAAHMQQLCEETTLVEIENFQVPLSRLQIARLSLASN